MSLRDPDLRLHTGRYYDLTQAEDWEKTMRQIVCAVELKEQIKDKRLQQALPSAMCYYSESFSMRMYTGKLLPGVTCGDIGHKFSRQGLDNNWIQFATLFLDQCKNLRKDAVPLVDAWTIPGFMTKAPIGKRNGNIYPAYFGIVNATQKPLDPLVY
ncbi:hypothetical protein BGZ50_009661 [Haplosporangium sp. Z 11]|nr:hypothetical protein BGZ50_009661 [Haplosporangium sp. Z 11]